MKENKASRIDIIPLKSKVCVCERGKLRNGKGDPDRNFRLTRSGETFRFDRKNTFFP